MSSALLRALIVCVLFVFSANAADLYLLKLESYEAYKVASRVIDEAHSIIDGKFIVHIDAEQIGKLRIQDIKLELLQSDCQLETMYLVIKEHNKPAKSSIMLDPVYSSGNRYIIALEESSIDILSRERYAVFCLADKKTPIFYKPPVYSAPALDYYPTDTLADMVNIDSLYSYVSQMEAFYTRFTPSDSNHRARDWIGQKFIEFGYTDTAYDYFLSTREWMGVIDEPAWNVLCIKEGTEKPDEWIMMGAHYDSYASNGLYDPAPGADDNASGVAAFLELARIFKNYDFKRSLMFIGFGAEEQWMDGSEHLANWLYEDSTDIEFLVNFDVIAYEADTIPNFHITNVQQSSYCDVFLDAITRLNDLIPFKSGTPLDDDALFHELGYQTLAMYEFTFHPQMHTPWDVVTSLDFSYMRKQIQLAATALPIIDAALEPTEPVAYDIGDGQSLRVAWNSCFDDCSYKIIYGTSLYNFSDTVEVPLLNCNYDLTGLSEGTKYLITVLGYPLDGYPQVGYILTSGTPLIIPRTPSDFIAEIDSNQIILNWRANQEIDFNHYKILRKTLAGSWAVIADNLTDTSFIDNNAENYVLNFYTILAYDMDENESDSASIVMATPATFDKGILLVEETQSGGINPSEANQAIYYANIFSGYSYTVLDIDSTGEALSRSIVGQYNPVFWIDDDDYNHALEGSIDSLKWYLGYNTDFLLAGWSTIYAITGQRYFYPGSFYYDELGISYIAQNPMPDFLGADGLNGWPDLDVKPDAPGGGRLANIDIFTAADGAEVIFTFNSNSVNSPYNGKPVGIAYDTHEGKRVVLGFPLYWLTEADAQALITRVIEYFAEESIHPLGDANNDWSVNLLDVTYLISYLYMGGSPPVDINNGDPNGDCSINILDITYVISYLYKGGPEPIEGCVY